MEKKDESEQIARIECSRIGAEVEREYTETISVKIQKRLKSIEESPGDQAPPQGYCTD